MGTLIGAIIARTGWSETAARLVAYVLLALLVLGALAAGKCAYDRSVITTQQTKVEHRAAPATDQAASERANDSIAEAKSEQEAHDVIHSVPDAAPAAPSHALACKRLHDLGRDPPACR
jgi:hypothetical protein